MTKHAEQEKYNYNMLSSVGCLFKYICFSTAQKEKRTVTEYGKLLA